MDDSTPVSCSVPSCDNLAGNFLCPRGCKAMNYCSAECRDNDCSRHLSFCGCDAYIFDLTLVDSSSPVINRTFEIPSWYTFEQLHWTIQYAMGWETTHMHEFAFYSRAHRGPRHTSFSHNDKVLDIGPEELYQDSFDDEELPEFEHRVTLRDVYGSNGRFKSRITNEEGIATLVYTYDLGDCWEHELTLQGTRPAKDIKPFFISASGRCPVEDTHGVTGWNDVKKAFLASEHATRAQQQLLSWYGGDSGFDPFEEPDTEKQNDTTLWGDHLLKMGQIARELYESD
ncbi:MM3350-like domain-containing protein [Flammula alnicola]|nr:MM3350-like domain-containing protein [Flammula alnicola]